ncbi:MULTISPECIES: ATP-binding protein [unclassified Bartonella]|uniref:ATP-binding protein n=1 Tax=Bartonella TaxID=773 RepID=UPI00099990B6|nr:MULTISPECIES: ATP-binding protein [unclassified Bartonella]AQX18679.1 two-component system, cell cycle sensor histidine kinase PleC [Bartonella sp. A1379B]AQX23191.1 two-component system, cell cycle sensor histidine kinase PleC [Bartonella sp. 11B]AQX25647.1 two-component system, cell cycle sensor histidine kinase PleC [Bartonella sp. Coyote22sub2]
MAKLDVYNAATRMHSDSKPSASNRRVGVTRISNSIYQKLLFIEPWLRRSIPFAIIISLIVLATIRFASLYDWRHTIDKNARSILSLLSSSIVNKIDHDLLAFTQQKKVASLSPNHLQNILITFHHHSSTHINPMIAILDRNGNILASSNSEIISGESLQDFISGNIISWPLKKNTGIIPITIEQEPALASFSQTDSGQYGVFISATKKHIYTEWEKKFSLNITLLIGTVSIILVLLYAYYNQVTRARNTDLISEKIQNRIDMAMMRGRCGLWDWNMASGRVYWSRAMYEMLGYEPQNALLSISQITAIIDPKDANFFELAQELMESKKKHIDINVPMRHAEGHYVWMRIRAEVTDEEEPHLVGISFDISEQHQFAEQTAQADLRIRDAIENISESFVLWDSEGRLVMSNSKFCEYAAIPKQMLQSGIERATVEAMSRPAISEYPLKIDESGNLTSIRQTANGYWLKINERRTQDGGLVCVGTDISELKQQQEKFEDSERRLFSFIQELKRARGNAQQRATEVEKLNKSLQEEKERAESANKAKSEFLANISHELRTPLNAILGFSEIMLQSTFGPLGSQRYKEYMHDIHNSGTHLLTLINDILDMSKIEAGRFTLDRKNINLEPIISETIRTLTPQAQAKKISLTTNIEQKLHADVDCRAMKQIFLNLISNAVKFTPSGGSIDIRAFQKNNNLIFSIKDTGVGIPQEAIKKLGQPFEQVENQFTKTHPGSGLGLAISRSLLELHKGKLEITSKEGKGTIVTIIMPIQQN